MPQTRLSSERCAAESQVLTKAVARASHVMGISQKELAEIIGLSPSTVSRMHNGSYCMDRNQKSWQLGLLLVRLFRGLDAICAGDEESLRSWLRSFNSDLNAVPLQHIASIQGLVTTADYVDASRAIV